MESLKVKRSRRMNNLNNIMHLSNQPADNDIKNPEN